MYEFREWICCLLNRVELCACRPFQTTTIVQCKSHTFFSLYSILHSTQGREASFSALAAAPLFAAKVPVGLLSGYLVHTYLPEDGSRRDGQTMWLIIGLLTL